MDYSFFDGLIDSVFVINEGKNIIYCNESAARLCDSSVRRLAKGKPIHSIIKFSDEDLFVMPNGEKGKNEPSPYSEMKFELASGKEGKVQISIQPFKDANGNSNWVVMVRDVTLEEVLHAKYHKQLEEKEEYIEKLKAAQFELENYSKNLEKMVEERTQEVNRANTMLNAIMESLGQGFLVFDQNGVCSNVFTKACEDILEALPSGKQIWDVLKIKPHEFDTFKMWLSAVFSEQLPFDSLKPLGPELYHHSREKYVTLDYFPLRNESDKITNLVLVATDKTMEFQANEALEKEKKFAKMVVKLVTNRKQFSQFLKSVKDTTEQVKKSLFNHEKIDFQFVFRLLHTLEGEAGTYSIEELWSASRVAQEILEPLKRGEHYDPQSVKNSMLEKIEFIDLALDQFLSDNKSLLDTLGVNEGDLDTLEIKKSDIYSCLDMMRRNGVSERMCDQVSNVLLREPIVRYLLPYRDVVTTVAQKLNKEMAPLEIEGGQLKIYTEHYETFFPTLVHAFRNAIDHGIESREDRLFSGKAAEGHIKVAISKTSDEASLIRIQISDDGGGISIEKLKSKLSTELDAKELDKMSEFEIIQNVFNLGISTKEEVGEYSGRGVGLNAVKIEAEKLGGKAWVESVSGKGTSLIVELPDLPSNAARFKAS